MLEPTKTTAAADMAPKKKDGTKTKVGRLNAASNHSLNAAAHSTQQYASLRTPQGSPGKDKKKDAKKDAAGGAAGDVEAASVEELHQKIQTLEKEKNKEEEYRNYMQLERVSVLGWLAG